MSGRKTLRVNLTPEADNAYVTATVRFGNFWWKARFCKVGGWDALGQGSEQEGVAECER